MQLVGASGWPGPVGQNRVLEKKKKKKKKRLSDFERTALALEQEQ